MRNFVILTVILFLSYLDIVKTLSRGPTESNSVRVDPLRKKIVIFGSTGRTGKRVVDQIYRSTEFPPNKLICPVRDMRRARSLLGRESARLSLVPCDLANDTFDKFVDILYGTDVVVICSSYVPKEGSLPSFHGSKKVDNIATKLVIDAAVAAGVSKVVLVSSLLTNGIGAGQIFNPQYLLLNAFGGVLINKRKAELHLQKQSDYLDYTIIRPGGLKDDEPSVPVLYGSADTLFGGSISRDQVAEVVAASCFLPQSKNKVIEIVATPDAIDVPVSVGIESIV